MTRVPTPSAGPVRRWFHRGRNAKDLRPPVGRARAHREVDQRRLLPAQQGRGRLHRHHPAAQRHGHPAHGSRDGRHDPGHVRALQPHARPLDPLDPGHRPRRHRDADQGRQEAQGRGHLAPRDRPREVPRRLLGLDPRVRRHDRLADQAHGLLDRLRRREVHDEPRVLARRPQGLRRLVPRRPDLPRQAHRQLVPELPHGQPSRPPTPTSRSSSARPSSCRSSTARSPSSPTGTSTPSSAPAS